MTLVHISVSGNLQPERHIPAALERLPQLGTVVGTSRFYVTPAVGRPDDPDYWNGVVALDTPLNRAELGHALRSIESDEHRVRTADPYASRTLDLDLLFWDGGVATAQTENEIEERPWLARCLGEVDAPGFSAGETPPGYPEAPVSF